MAYRIGQQIGNYRLVRQLGRGSFGDVYLGEHRYLKSYAALKVLQVSLANEKDVQRFLAEAQTVVRLRHSNLIRVLEYVVDRGTPVLVMDYAAGGTIRQRHPSGSYLSLATTVTYVNQVAAALQYAHNHSVIHRDVKPDNILLGSNHTLLLSDFGLALFIPSPELLSTQDMAGTLPYTAPEQLQGRPSFASDQYSLAIIAYEWLSGERPFHGNAWEIINQHIMAEPPPLRTQFPELPSAVEDVILRALAKEPQKRFTSVQAFALALAHASQESHVHNEVDSEITVPLKAITKIPLAAITSDQKTPSDPRTQRQVFLSATPADSAFVAHLKADLKAHGILFSNERPDMDADADDQEETIRHAIRAAYIALVVLSPHTQSSRTIKEHMRIANMYGRRIVFVWAGGNEVAPLLPIPDSWGKTAVIDVFDARGAAYKTALTKVVACIGSDAAEIDTLPDPAFGDAQHEPRNPYKGLRAFTIEEANDFFGRDTLIDEMIGSLRKTAVIERPNIADARLLAVIGPSGSGKSSVVMAGLRPRLQAEALPGSQRRIYLHPLVPGKRPLESLALTLVPFLPEKSMKSIHEDLEDDSMRGLHLLATSIVKHADTKVLLILDQFEEIFAQHVSEKERRHFIDLLLTAVTEPQGPTITILTLRADFYDRPMRYPELSRLIEAHHISVLPMELYDLRAAIEEPATQPDVQLAFESTLVGDLLFETQGQAGALPLLEFTLYQLFQRREGHWLTQRAYQEIGGVQGALAKHAEATYAALASEEHRTLARSLFLRLIDPGITEQDTTRRRAPMTELSLPDEKQTLIMGEVADAFVAARLLMTNESAGEVTIEVSHEALIREWTRLSVWLRTAREDIIFQQTISADASDWAHHGKLVDRLYRGTKLTEAQNWAERNAPSNNEVAFLHTSITEHERQEQKEHTRQVQELTLKRQTVNRLRALVVVLTLLLAVSVVFASVAQTLFITANNATASALAQGKNARSRAFAAQAYFALTKNQVDTALLLSTKANQVDNTFDARDSLLNALQYSPHLLSILQAPTPPASHVEILPDNQTVLSFDVNGDVISWNMHTVKGPTSHLDFRGKLSFVADWALSPDGQLLAGANSQGVWLWDMKTGARIAQLEPSDGVFAAKPLAFSPDGTQLAATRCLAHDASNTCTKSGIFLLNVASRQPIGQPLTISSSLITQLAFSHDGKTLFSSSRTSVPGQANGGIQLWNVASQTALTRNFAVITKDIVAFAISPNQKTLAISDGNDTISLWDVATQTAQGAPLNAKGVQQLAFSPDGKILAAGNTDKTVQVWNIPASSSSDVPLTLLGHSDTITSLAFSPDGKTLASSDVHGATFLWTMESRNALYQEISSTDKVLSTTFSPDGKVIAAGDTKGTVTLRDATTGNQLTTLDATLDPLIPASSNSLSDSPLTIESITFSPDGSILAAGRSDGMVFLWNATTLQPIAHFHDEKNLTTLVFRPHARMLAASYNTGVILLWDIDTGRILQHFVHSQSNSDMSSTIAFSPDGRMLASGYNNTVIFWNPTTGKQIGQPLTGHQAFVKSVAFSPDGRTLASIDSTSTILLWDTSMMKSIGQPFVNSDPTIPAELPFQRGLTFSPDGNLLAAGGDQSVTLWDITKHERRAHAFHTPTSVLSNYIRGVVFSPDGQHLLTISDTNSANYTLTLWNINVASWQSRACSIANRNLTLDEWNRFIGDEPYQSVCHNIPIDGSEIRAELRQAHADVQAGNKQAARAKYIQAVQEATPIDDADLSNTICWAGSTDQFAQEVLSACERTPILNPYNGNYNDSRGVARAATGNYRGAIADFKVAIQWITNEQFQIQDMSTQQLVDERNSWIQKLQAGQTPFDAKTLQSLRVATSIDK